MYNGYKIIALCITKVFEERGCDLVNSLNNALTEKGCRLFVYHSCSDFYWGKPNEESDKTVFQLMDFSVIDGVIIFGEKFFDTALIDSICSRAKETDTPVIIIGADKKDCISVKFGYEMGFEQVVRHVIEDHKIKDIFFIAGVQDNDFSEKRIAIYKKVLAENNIEFDPEKIDYGDFWWMPTENIMNRLYNENKLPRAFICENDSMAITVCSFLHKKNIRVPEDIIVTGFDGITEAMYNMPPITTCSLSQAETASVIADVFSRIFAGESVDSQYTIEFKLNIYSSCGCISHYPPLNKGELLKKADDRFMYYQGNEQLFYNMSEEVMICSDPKDIINAIGKTHLSSFAILLNENCFDNSVNPAVSQGFDGFDKNMILLLQDVEDKSVFPYKFERKNILPGIDVILEGKMPLLFNALGFMGNPYGYVCFYFDTDFDTYCRIQQYISALNYSIGSYRNVNYVRYIAKNIEYIADHDYMTGLLNRSGFYKRIDSAAISAENCGYMSVTLIDMDGLKYINDTFGHSCGDFAIKTIAEAVAAAETDNDKICGRFGGDEFVICTYSEDPERTAQRIRTGINGYLQKINDALGRPFQVSASIGTAAGKPHEKDFDALFREADEKMYEEKITRPHHRKKGGEQTIIDN